MKAGVTIVYRNSQDTLKKVQSKVPFELKEIEFSEIRTVIPVIREMNENKFLQFEERIKAKKDRCFIASVNDKPVHFSWLRTKNSMHVGSAGRTYSLPENSAWIFDCRTSENYRGQGIYPAVISMLCKDLFNQYKNIYIDTSQSNKSSISGIIKAGFSEVMKIYRLGRIKIAFPSELK